ncbi:MAG: hypothetical protein HY907_16220 [Deltaproteobacteria bacterium]|nr:hypothetical protein [Deltaproteobacteria bacterium]
MTAFGVWGAGCSAGADDAVGPRDGGEVRDGASEAVDGAETDGGTCTGPGDCPAGQYCSGSGHCIGEGTCLVDADCGAGRRCGGGSLVCLDEGACVVDGDCASGLVCDEAASRCVPGGCGGTEFTTTRLPPNMMIVLDRSGSMDGDVDGRTRWDVAKEAIAEATFAFDDQIRFGLTTYSACRPGGCSPGEIVVPIADYNAVAIDEFLAPLLGRGSLRGIPPNYLCDSGNPETSTGRTLLRLVGEPSLLDPLRDNSVLLVTDGQESGDCTSGGENGPAGAAALLGQDPPVRTYVVGFSRDVDAGQLTAVAEAGGTDRYYQADSAADLITALEEIAGREVTCDFRLEGDVPDPAEIYVYFNDDPAGIPTDIADGWSYDESTGRLEFHGAACDRILAGEVSDIDVVYGCPGPVIG